MKPWCSNRRCAAALVMLVLASFGCKGRKECSADSDCLSGQTCVQWKGTPGVLARTSCLRLCKSKDDCQKDEICIALQDHGAGVAACQQVLVR